MDSDCHYSVTKFIYVGYGAIVDTCSQLYISVLKGCGVSLFLMLPNLAGCTTFDSVSFLSVSVFFKHYPFCI